LFVLYYQYEVRSIVAWRKEKFNKQCMKTGSPKTIEDRLKDIEKEVHQVKMLLTEFLGSQPKSRMEDEESLMNVKDVAKFLKVEVAVVYAAYHKGQIPFLKVGKLYKIKKLMY